MTKRRKDTLESARKQQAAVLDYTDKDHQWWSNFKDESEYQTAVRYDGYNQKYSGQKYTDLQKALGILDDGEEKKWLTSYADYVDYDEKSKYDLTAGRNEIKTLEAQLSELNLDRAMSDPAVASKNDHYGFHYEPKYDSVERDKKIEELNNILYEKRRYFDEAKYIQDLAVWNSVTGKSDFNQKNKYVSNVQYERFGMPYFTDDTYAYVNNPTVADKRPLGGGDVSARALIDREDAINKADTPGRNRGSSYERDALEQITDEEIAIYNYYYATEGKEKAREYLDFLVDTFKQRKDVKTGENVAKFATEHPVLSSAMSVGTSLGSGAEYIGDVLEYAGDKVWGKDAKLDRNENALVTNAVRGAVAEKVDWEIGNWDAFDFVYNTTMSGIDSAASLGFGGMAAPVLGLSAAAQATNDAMNRGMSDGQAFWNGIVAGVFECLFEELSIGHFKKLTEVPPNSIKDIFKNLGKSMLVNASEETLTEIANIGYDTLVNGEFANYTLEELENGAWKQALAQVLEAGASGMLMGLGMGGAGNAIGYYSGAKAMYGDSTQELIQEGLESDPNSRSYKLAQKYQQKTAGENGKELSGVQIRKLVKANEAQFKVENFNEVLSEAKERLTELGQTENVDEIANLVAKRVAGQKMTREEKSTLARSQYGSKVAKEINDAAKENRVTYQSLTERVGEEPRYGVSKSGQTEIRATDAEVDGEAIKIKSVSKIEEGQLYVKLEDGSEVYAGDIDFANDSEAALYSAIADMENITPAAATALVKNFDATSQQSVSEYVNGIDEAYTYGYHGYSVEDMKVGDYAVHLSNEQMMSAYRLGQSARAIGIETHDAPLVQMRTAKQAAISKKQATQQLKAQFDSENVEVYFEDGANVVKFDEHSHQYDEKRMAGVNAAKFLSRMGIGGKYYFYESKVKNGVRVYKNSSGNWVKAPNGIFKAGDGSIHIDLNAGQHGEGTTLFTLSHELTHFVKANSEKQFQRLADLVKEAYDKTDMTMHERVVAKQNQLSKNRNGEHVDYADAYEEVVADAMSTMLADGNIYEKLAQLKTKDKGLFETIKRFFNKMIAKFKELYASLTPDQKDAQDIRKMKDMFDRIQDAFAKALAEASDNFHANETVLAQAGISVDADTDAGSIYSVRDVLNETDRDKVAKALAERFGVTEKEAKEWLKAETSLASLILNPKYSMYLDYEGDPNEVAIKQNSDYPQGTVDFSNICKKRREFTQVMNRVLRNFPNHVFAATDLAKIRTIMGEEGMTLPCGICYVEDRRQLDTIVAQDFINGLKLYREGSKTRPDGKPFNANQLKGLQLTDGDTYVPTIYELVSLEGRNSLKAKNPNMEAAWVRYNNARGMQAVRLLTNEAEYQRQILKYNKKTVQSKNDHGGLRIYSFSDAEMFHLIDIIQVITDSAAVGLSLQGYTKVNEYAKAVKDTGEKLNRSLIPKGDLGYHMENGKVVLDYDTVEGIDIYHEDFFDNKDNPDVGNITIGINDVQIRASMVSDFVDQIIPFHTGQSEEVLGEKGIAAWENYKDSQTEKDLATGRTASHQVNIYTEVFQAAEAEGKPIQNKRQFVEKFLQVCKENGLQPRFAQFLNTDANGDYVYTEGYHKFLVDFKTFAQTEVGEYLPQMPVKPIFDDAYITGLLEAYVKEQQVKDAEVAKQMPKVIKRITDEIVKADEKHSDRTPKWKPNLDSAEWDIVKYTVDNNQGTAITSTCNMFFKKSKGKTLFGIYSTDDSTLLYASRGQTAEKENIFVGRLREEFKNGNVTDTSAEGLRAWSKTVRMQRATNDYHGSGNVAPGRSAGNAGLHGRSSGLDSSAALRNVLENIFQKETAGRVGDRSVKNSDRDSEGNQLSKEQQEYFKDSKARDENGNLVPVYHTSQTAGYYTLGGKKGRGHYKFEAYKGKVITFFTDDYEMSSTYAEDPVMVDTKSNGKIRDAAEELKRKVKKKSFAGTYKGYVNITKPYIIDAKGNNWARIPSEARIEKVTTEEKSALKRLLEIANNQEDEFYTRLEDVWVKFYHRAKRKKMSSDERLIAKAAMKISGELSDMSWEMQDIFILTSVDFDAVRAKELFTPRATTNENVMKALDAGIYDGVIIKNVIDYAGFPEYVMAPHDVYVTFQPEQFKAVDNRTPTKAKDIRYSERDSEQGNAPVFYSRMGKVVEGMKQEKFGASSVISMLRGKGVKAEEIRWSGIQAFLEGKKSVTKADLLDFIKGSMLHIEEERRVENEPRDEFVSEWRRLVEYLDYDEIIDGLNYIETSMQPYLEDLVENEQLNQSEADHLLDLARKAVDSENLPTKWHEYKLAGGKNYREMVFKMPGTTYTNRAMQAHWGDEAEGVLAHARMQDFEVDSKKMLFIEEIQSDWHNEGQRSGYGDSLPEADKNRIKEDAMRKFIASDVGKQIVQKTIKHYGLASETEAYQRIIEAPANVGSELIALYPYWMTEERTEAIIKLQEQFDEVDRKKTPDAPFKGNYHEFVLKRLIRMAAEEGYDSIGWTTADIQSQRWSDEYAEGYRIEYDQDIPKFLKKYGKQWGAEVGKTPLPGLDGGETYYDVNREEIFATFAEWKNTVLARLKSEGVKSRDVVFEKEHGSGDFIAYDDFTGMEYDRAKVNKRSNTVWSMDITPAMKKSVLEEGQALYSERTEDSVSNRSLLANAFEGIAQNSVEYKMLQDYRDHIKQLNKLEDKLSDLNAEIRKIRFGTEGARDTERLRQLEDEAKKVAKEINRYDKRLLNMEASEPLRKVIDREKAKAAQKTRERVKEIQQNKKARADQTELRHKIRKAVRDLDKILNRGNKKLNVKEDMQVVVAKALKAADILFTDNYGTYDMLRNGIGTDLSDAEEELVNTCARMLKDIDKMPSDGYESWQARQEAEERLKIKMSKLKDVFARERKRLNNTTVSSILGELADAYASLEKSEQSYVQGAYTEAVHNFLKSLQSEVGGTIVKDMTKSQLESVYAAYQMVLNTVRNANKMFNEALKQSREQLGNAVIQEVVAAGGNHGLWTKGEIARNQASWNNMKPVWVANRIGSETFGKLMGGLFKGQYNFAVDVDEAKKFKLSMDEKYHPRNWDAKKLYSFESSTGRKFELNLQQIMSLYAFSKREQAYSHILNGGFVFEANSTVLVDKKGIKRTYLHDGATSYKLNEVTLNEIIGSLTTEQKAYVDEMQKYLSEVMGAKGNEVSMKLYGIKMFKEQFYFPLRSSGAYMEKAKEAEMKKQQGQINIVNSGFTHAVKPEAKNPIILSGFLDVWAEHCNEMSMYHSMVLPMEDFRKVYNYSTVHDEKMDSASVYQTIQDAYGKAATGYIDQLYRELNAGATVDPRETAFKARISKFKKAAVMLSASVVVQQFSSIGRAYAVIDPKYFVGAKVKSDTKLSVADEMKKYAPVAIIKEMGGFDTGTKGSAKNYIMAEEYHKTERIKGILKDEQYRTDIMGYFPAKADELTWCNIWEAVKRETKAKHQGMDVKSEEFLKLAGERFSEIIEKTQVYDSVLARSANMRSKGGLMSMATAFMAEPTTTVNLLEDALRGRSVKNIARAFGAVASSIILNNALASIIYAMRDDDDDETFIEKYFQSFASGMVDDINPMTYYPFLKDVYSLFQGYDVERADMSVIADLRDALKQAYSAISKYNPEMDEDELSEYYKSVNGSIMSILDAGCSVLGVPMKNVRRDVSGVINAYQTISKDLTERDTSWNTFWDKVGAAVKDTIPIYAWTKDKPKQDKLYDAIMSGDKTYLGRIKSTYKTEDAYTSAVRKVLRENDPRIREAAEAKYEANSAAYKRIFREIQSEGHFSFNDIMSAINSEISSIKKEREPASETSEYSATDFVNAVVVGEVRNAETMRDEIIATKVANGDTREEAEKSFAGSVSTSTRKAFDSNLLDEAGVEKMLTKYAGMDEEEAAAKTSYWAFIKAHPKYREVLSQDHVEKYHEFAEPAEIPLDVFAQYVTGTKGLQTIRDDWGDEVKSKREQVLEVIDSLPLTWQQKDALYLAAGYAESKILDVPW